MPNSNPFTILTAIMVVITMLMISSCSLVSGTSFIASSTGENVTIYTGRDIKADILTPLSASNLTNYQAYTNGTAIATFTGNHTGIKVYYNHTMTPDNGFAFENGTIYFPDGRELRILLDWSNE